MTMMWCTLLICHNILHFQLRNPMLYSQGQGLCIESPQQVLSTEPDSIRSPDIYLGANLKLMQLKNSVWALGASFTKYAMEIIKNFMDYISDHLSPQ